MLFNANRPTPEVRDSRTSHHSAHAQSQFRQIWLVLVSSYCVYKAIQNRNVVGPGQRSRFMVLTKRSAASGDENVLFTLKNKRNVGWCWRRCLMEIKLRSTSSNIMQHRATWWLYKCNMLDSTMLDDATSTCWIRLDPSSRTCLKSWSNKVLCVWYITSNRDSNVHHIFKHREEVFDELWTMKLITDKLISYYKLMEYLNIFLLYSIPNHFPQDTSENAKMCIIISNSVVDEVVVGTSSFGLLLTFHELLELFCVPKKRVLFRGTHVF